VTRAFERVAYPKISQQLRHEDPVVRLKALRAVCELLAEPGPASCCVAAGVPDALLDLCGDADPAQRRLAAEALTLVMRYDRVAFGIVDSNRLPVLVDLLEDAEGAVRDAAYTALIEAARFERVRLELIGHGATLPMIVEQLGEEAGGMARKELGLRLLDACLNVQRNEEALAQCSGEADCLLACAGLLAGYRPVTVREKAALLLARMTATLFDQKRRAVQMGCVKDLADLLAHPVLAAKLAAATALMNLTTVNEGKDAFFETGACDTVLRLIHVRHHVLRVHVLSLLCNVGEHPGCRAWLQPLVPTLRDILNTSAEDPTAERFASQALRQIEFENRPFTLLPQPEV
jgi:hypothetical protein